MVSVSRFNQVRRHPRLKYINTNINLIARSSAAVICQEAYEDAKASLLQELTESECKRIWISRNQSLEDVQKILQDARSKYEGKKTSKARKWLQIFSSRVTHYGGILDVLVQHHPEYVSLAWGAMKFLFIVSCPRIIRLLSSSE
jgi:hypothetical protein